MNAQAQELKLKNTIFDTPHGLQNSVSVSTAQDMAILTYNCMQVQIFTEVVKSPSFTCQSKLKVYEWQNTNKLLQGYSAAEYSDSDESIF
jgi:serine-type D-Ala-D-Ala carboxypeptidase (penicillin-binding protein 5/6)